MATGPGSLISATTGVASITSAASLFSPAPTASATSSAASSSSSRGPQVFTVKVGSGGFKYEPNELHNVSIGDTVTFEFYPPDHSVARAEYLSPCVPYEYTGKNKVGFWSGTQNVSSINDLTHWNLTINSTEPIFYYCTAPDSCIGHQMVGVINPNDTQTIDAQEKAAQDSSFMVKPGDPIPAEGSATLSATSAPAATASPSTTSSTHNHSLSGGVIAGIVVGAVGFLVICAALFFYVGRTKSLKEVIARRDATVARNSEPHPGAGPGAYHHPGSPGYPSTPFSPNHTHAEHGGQLPAYGQHNATDAHPSGWASPMMRPEHMSAGSQPQMAEVKDGYLQQQVHEMASPPPAQQTFTHELEAPIKAPR